jgi:hypothetical protein
VDAFEVGRIVGQHAAGGAVAGAVLAALVKDGVFTFSVAELSKGTRAEYQATWRCLQKLEELGAIEVENLPDRRYRVRPGPGSMREARTG